ncbi:hypothetical protein SBV42_00005 [Chlamydia crocodili]|uniref:hypothetical protein n=1 Tax=Chlamydia crocodili TaxID=2766982 RepID=UPI003D4B4198
MNLAPPHSDASASLPIAQASFKNKLYKNIALIGGVFCLALSTVFAITLACGFTQPIILACLLVSIIVAGVMLALAIHRIVRGDMRHSLPSGLWIYTAYNSCLFISINHCCWSNVSLGNSSYSTR